MQRPVLTIQRDTSDLLVDIVALVAIAALWGVPAYFYSSLPDTIPTHFGFDGKPDDWGEKWFLWIVPGLATTMYIFLHFLSKFPHLFNYTTTINQDNALRQYTLATKLIRRINTLVLFMLLYINISIVFVALQKMDGLSFWVVPGFIIVLMGTLVYYLYLSAKKHPANT